MSEPRRYSICQAAQMGGEGGVAGVSVGLPIVWLPVSRCIVYEPPMASARIAAALSVERAASMEAQRGCKLIMQGYLVKVFTQKRRKAGGQTYIFICKHRKQLADKTEA